MEKLSQEPLIPAGSQRRLGSPHVSRASVLRIPQAPGPRPGVLHEQLAGSPRPRGQARHAARCYGVAVCMWDVLQDRDGLQGKRGRDPPTKLQVEMSLPLTAPAPQKRTPGSNLARHRGVGVPTCTRTPPWQRRPKSQPPEDKVREEERSPILPVPFSLGMCGGTGHSSVSDPRDMK